MEVIKSVYESQTAILGAIQALHCPNGFECDLTYGNGGFWKGITEPQLCFDKQPLADHVIEADSTDLPLDDDSLNNLVFDPPFLTYVKNGREHGNSDKMVMSKRFSGYWSYDELATHYAHTLKEAARVLKKKGIMVFKCQDIIHNHKMHCTHHNILVWASSMFRLKDLFILTAKHRMSRKVKQQHARIYHSYFLVLEKVR
jgi:hypothetical protein